MKGGNVLFPRYQCISHHREPPLHSELPECLDQENFAANSIYTLIEWMYSDEVFCFIFCSPGIRKGTFYLIEALIRCWHNI
jgi:hypothetical protein